MIREIAPDQVSVGRAARRLTADLMRPFMTWCGPRRRTGIDFDPHWYRHAYATRLLRGGAPVEVVSSLLGHSSIATTMDVYGHLTAEDARHALEAAGFLTGREVRW